MSEAADRAEMERRLMEKGLAEDAFRQRLLEDPKGAVERELGTRPHLRPRWVSRRNRD
jgi:hypothetical protein